MSGVGMFTSMYTHTLRLQCYSMCMRMCVYLYVCVQCMDSDLVVSYSVVLRHPVYNCPTCRGQSITNLTVSSRCARKWYAEMMWVWHQLCAHMYVILFFPRLHPPVLPPPSPLFLSLLPPSCVSPGSRVQCYQ